MKKFLFACFASLFCFYLLMTPAYAIYYSFKNSLVFNAISSRGNIKLMIKQIGHHRRDILVAPKNITFQVRHHTLYIKQSPTYSRKKNVVKIRLHRLNKLLIAGKTQVFGYFNSKYLTIRAENRSRINLRGSISLRQLVSGAASKIKITGINSKKLALVVRGNSQVTLAGRVINLVARLGQYGKLNAKKLKAQSIMLQTRDSSVAMVFPKRALYAFADNHSNIYYYNKPKTISQNAKGSGNILQGK